MRASGWIINLCGRVLFADLWVFGGFIVGMAVVDMESFSSWRHRWRGDKSSADCFVHLLQGLFNIEMAWVIGSHLHTQLLLKRMIDMWSTSHGYTGLT